MKTPIRQLSILLLTPFLFGCINSGTALVSDKSTAVASVSNLKPAEIYFSCQRCEGITIYSFNIKEGQSPTVKADVTVESGSLTFTITDSNKETLFSEQHTAKANFDIRLENYGKYRIEITHEKFKGSYRLNWEKK